jgi:hypothetical protein
MAGSMFDTGEVDTGLLRGMEKPVQYLRRVDGRRDGGVQVTEPGVMPSASVVDYVEQSDDAISVDRSVTATPEKAVRNIAPISQQVQEFQDGLRKLAVQFENREMLSEEPFERLEDCSHHLGGGKRKREDQDPSKRKLQKVVVSEMNVSETSTREPQAVEWTQEESGMQGVARLTPGSTRLSIRDFFKPGVKTGES